MGGDATTQSPLWGDVGDEGGTPKDVVGDSAEVRTFIEGGDDDREGGDEG